MLYERPTINLPATSVLAADLDMFKVHLKGVDDSEEELTKMYLMAAGKNLEAQYGVVLTSRSGSALFRGVPCIGEGLTLPLAPVSAVSAVRWSNTDAPDTWTVVDSAKYAVVIDRHCARVEALKSWEITGTLYRVKVDFTAGYGATYASVPEDIRVAMQLLATDLYNNRADSVKQLPTAVEVFMKPYIYHAA